jgi:hypothetical protein
MLKILGTTVQNSVALHLFTPKLKHGSILATVKKYKDSEK